MLKKAFDILRHHKIFIKLSKCAFGQQETEYLGHIVTSQGLKFIKGKFRLWSIGLGLLMFLNCVDF